jgi:hypothetical protein
MHQLGLCVSRCTRCTVIKYPKISDFPPASLRMRVLIDTYKVIDARVYML